MNEPKGLEIALDASFFLNPKEGSKIKGGCGSTRGVNSGY